MGIHRTYGEEWFYLIFYLRNNFIISTFMLWFKSTSIINLEYNKLHIRFNRLLRIPWDINCGKSSISVCQYSSSLSDPLSTVLACLKSIDWTCLERRIQSILNRCWMEKICRYYYPYHNACKTITCYGYSACISIS